jgi:hypothetical protein
VGEHSRKTGMRPGGSAKKLRLTPPACQQETPVGDSCNSASVAPARATGDDWLPDPKARGAHAQGPLVRLVEMVGLFGTIPLRFHQDYMQ